MLFYIQPDNTGLNNKGDMMNVVSANGFVGGDFSEGDPPHGWGHRGAGRPRVFQELDLQLERLMHRPFDVDGGKCTKKLDLKFGDVILARRWQRQIANVQRKRYKDADWKFQTTLSKVKNTSGYFILYVRRVKIAV